MPLSHRLIDSKFKLDESEVVHYEAKIGFDDTDGDPSDGLRAVSLHLAEPYIALTMQRSFFSAGTPCR